MWTLMDSPVGELRIVEQDGAITAIEFSAVPRPSTAGRAATVTTTPGTGRDGAPAARVLRPRPQGVRPAARADRAREFQQSVWEQLRRSATARPRRTARSRSGSARTNAASRAVGLANGRNPIPIVIPCHRVIGADGTLTGYAGGIERKQTLLELEQDALF